MKELNLHFPLYSDFNDLQPLNLECVKNLRGEEVLIEFPKQLEDCLNDYLKGKEYNNLCSCVRKKTNKNIRDGVEFVFKFLALKNCTAYCIDDLNCVFYKRDSLMRFNTVDYLKGVVEESKDLYLFMSNHHVNRLLKSNDKKENNSLNHLLKREFDLGLVKEVELDCEKIILSYSVLV